ncbi:DeoR/GlpR family DNA-binding transcription regulator [Pseudopelagicola sp. nBUS_19]|uniref:DeoR/GlpR family DNA-binding transcription regulator n=1 Tax=unclassified Pseudopelagicola TaxID=2649563 RepID=UPI003EB871DC
MESSFEIRRRRLRKQDRREQILFELKLQPHVRVSDMAERFGVSTETVRRDLDQLSEDGLISRAHGGASSSLKYPDFEQRSCDRLEEREVIGRSAAALVESGNTVMMDSGSTMVQLARFLAYAGTPCTVITNSLAVAMTLGQSENAEVIVCPGDYVASEAAVVGTDTIEFLERHYVDRCLIGARGLSEDGISETIRGFAAIKRVMLNNSRLSHLLIDSNKFDQSGLSHVGKLNELTSMVADTMPKGRLAEALKVGNVEVIVAEKLAA